MHTIIRRAFRGALVVVTLGCGDSLPTVATDLDIEGDSLDAGEYRAPLASIAVTFGRNPLVVGDSTHAIATLRDASGRALPARVVTWASSNNGIATHDQSGRVWAVSPGTVTITASRRGITGSAQFTVRAPVAATVPVATVTTTLAASSLTVGQGSQGAALLRDAAGNTLTGRAITWSSSNNGIATVNATGYVTGVATGTAQITATSEGQSGTVTTTVTAVTVAPVATVSVSLALASLQVGATTQAAAVTLGTASQVLTGRVLTWSSSNAAVATVSTAGMVTAIAAGSASISANSEGKTGAATLTVTIPAPLPPPPVSGAGEPAYSAATQQLIFRDEFDAYTSFADANANGWKGLDGANVSDRAAISDPLGANQIVGPGFDGTGKALRLIYTGGQTSPGTTQEARAWSHAQPDALAAKPGRPLYISYYFRITPGGGFQLDQDASHIIQIKWLQLWNLSQSSRAQFATAYSNCINDVPFPGASGSGTLFQFHGGTPVSSTACQAGQVRAPFAYRGTGQWHRATHKYVTRSSAGARDGVAQMWVDGVLVVSVNASDCGVPVPGGVGGQAWCTTADLDGLFVQDGVSRFTLGGVNAAAPWPFIIDYDRMVMWRD